MCISFVWVGEEDVGVRYVLVVASNRDEFLSRPTVKARWWEQCTEPRVFAPQDALRGGTWLGVAGTEKVERTAVLTNVREPPMKFNSEERPSRGHIVAEYLMTGRTPPTDGAAYERHAAPSKHEGFDGAAYEGFNLLTFEKSGVAYRSNRFQSKTAVGPGAHVLSNGALDAPWPKAQRGLAVFKQTLDDCTGSDEDLARTLLDVVLSDETECAPATDTGLSVEYEKLFAYVCVPLTDRVGPVPYGTRTQTVILVRRDGSALLAERDRDPDGRWSPDAVSVTELFTPPL